MDPLTLMLISSAIGEGLGLMGAEEKKKQIAAQRPIEAVKAKWYGYDHVAPQTFADPNYLGEFLQGGLGGFAQGANIASMLGAAGVMGKQGQAQPMESFSPQSQNLSYPESKLLGTGPMGNQDFPQLQAPSGYLGTPSAVPGSLGGFSTEVGTLPNKLSEPMTNMNLPMQTPSVSSPILPTTLPKKKPSGAKPGKKVSAWQDLLQPYGTQYWEGV